MSTAGETFKFIKRLILLDEDMSRLTEDIKKVDATLAEHERRIIRLEVTSTMTLSPRRVILSGD